MTPRRKVSWRKRGEGQRVAGRCMELDARSPREPLLDGPQDGQDVHAVDAAIRPEIEQHDFAAQIAHTDGLFGVEPFRAGGKIRRVDFAFEDLVSARRHGFSFLLLLFLRAHACCPKGKQGRKKQGDGDSHTAAQWMMF